MTTPIRPSAEEFRKMVADLVMDARCAFAEGGSEMEAVNSRYGRFFGEHGTQLANLLTAQAEEIARLRDWQCTVTAALRRDGGSFYEDVPRQIRELRAHVDDLRDKLATHEAAWRDEQKAIDEREQRERAAFRAGFIAHPDAEAEVFTWNFDPEDRSLARDREQSAWEAYRRSTERPETPATVADSKTTADN